MSLAQRMNQQRGAMPPGMREAVDQYQRNELRHWVPLEDRYNANSAVRIIPVTAVKVEPPPDIYKPELRRNADIGKLPEIIGKPKAPRNQRDFGKGTCIICGTEFQRKGTAHRTCNKDCFRVHRNAYARQYGKVAAKEDRTACAHEKWTSQGKDRIKCVACKRTMKRAKAAKLGVA